MIAIEFPDQIKKYMELQCNSNKYLYTNFPELTHIKSYLTDLNPKNVLDIGSGIGRASVFFFKYFDWEDTTFYLLDGNYGTKQIYGIKYNLDKAYYNSLEHTELFCNANKLTNYKIVDADSWKSIQTFPKFDLVYSFLAIGFHFELSLYLNECLEKFLHKDSLLIFGIRGYQHHNWNISQINKIDTSKYKILEVKEAADSKKDRNSVLILEYKGAQMQLDEFKLFCAHNYNAFINQVLPLDKIVNGICLAEGFAFCMMCKFLDVERIIESGTAGGRSTEMFAKYLNIPIYTIDNLSIYGEHRQKETQERLSKYKNITCIEGDSFIEIPKLLEDKDKKTAIFIDGPKALKAYLLCASALKYSNTIFIGVHDTCLPNRYHDMNVLKDIFFYTDADWFYEKYTNLFDDDLYERGAGIGFILNTKENNV